MTYSRKRYGTKHEKLGKESPNKIRRVFFKAGDIAVIGTYISIIKDKLMVSSDEAEKIIRDNIDNFDIVSIGYIQNGVLGYKVKKGFSITKKQ